MEELKITLAAARVNAGLTQQEVAKKLKISRSTIINWENGKSKPSFASLQSLSSLYNIPANYIFLDK